MIASSISLGGCAPYAGLHSYAGRWVLRSSGKNTMLLTTHVQGRGIKGTLFMPKHATENWLGFQGVSLPMETLPVTGKWKKGKLRLVLGFKGDRDRMTMRLTDNDHALIDRYHGIVPDWKFERVQGGQKVTVYTDWPVYNLEPGIVALRKQLRTMAEQDAAAREKRWIDPKETDYLSESDKPLLETIFARYGWPKVSVFGVQACDDFWILVQHQPLPVEEQMLPAMKNAMDAGEASKRNYLHLYDRVQIGEGKPQHWGTQSSCENGRAVLSPVDDMTGIEERRKEAGLDTLADSLKGSNAICARVRQ
ncbi:MAG: DUF6624 domain-containing protein [Candidatus Acidiferrales bacterium]